MDREPRAAEPIRRHRIRPRAPKLPGSEAIPRHWFGGNALATHIGNGLHLLLPAGERFFVRSVLHFRDRIEDPALDEQVRGFCGQEGHHAHAHEELFEILREQGLRIDGYLRWYERLAYGLVARVATPKLRLAATVALEHFTAILAENALSEDLLDPAHPHVRALLLWHAAEEIEHKSVAFDVLRQVDPSYALRMAGLVAATLGLAGFWLAGALALLWQDRRALGWRRLAEEWRWIRGRSSTPWRVLGRGIREYVRRGFHPWQNDNLELARAYLAEAGMA
jgi:uncharacterized protein